MESELIHSPLFTQNNGDSAARKKKKRKKKKKEGGRTCGGFEAVLLEVADRITAWTVVGFSSSSLRFFSSALFSSVSVFFSVSSSVHCAGAVINDGEDGGSGVALVVAMLTATGSSSSFLSFFVFTSKTWQWRWWCCCCSSCPCRGACFFFLFTGVTARRGRW